MTGRLVAGIVFLIVLCGANVAMLMAEEIEPGPTKAKAEAAPVDQLAGLQYISSARPANLKAMGLDSSQADATMAEMGALEQRLHLGQGEKDQIRFLLDNTEDIGPIENAFCGRSPQLPSRYAALAFLVEEKQGELRVRDLAGMNTFDEQEWAAKARISTLVQQIEFIEARQEDATRMGFAAVLAAQTETAIKGDAPWGTSLWNNWSWESVKKKYESVESKVVRYTAVMHLVLEATNGEGGMCRTE